MDTKDKDHILSNFVKDNFYNDPFPYFIFENLFSEEYYKTLIHMKPLDQQFKKTSPDRTSNQYALKYRKRFSFVNDMNLLDQERKIFWQKFINFFTSNEFINNLLLMCKKPILNRYKINDLNKLRIDI